MVRISSKVRPGVAAAIIRLPQLVVLLLTGLTVAAADPGTPTYNPPNPLIFGGDAAYPPFEWLEQGVPKGFNIDLATASMGISGIRVEYKLGDWPDTVRALESGDVDVVPMFISPERQEQFLFTMPFHYIDHAIYAHEETAPVYAVEELTQKRVAVEERSFAERQLDVEGIGATKVPTANTVKALFAVEDGSADYAVLAAPIADRLIQEYNLPVKRLGPPFWPRGYALAVGKDRAELRNWLQQALELAVSTGVYQDVYEIWQADLKYRNPDNARITRGVLAGLLVLASLAAVALCWSWMLRRTVQARTSDLRAAESEARHLADFDVETGTAKPHYFAALVDAELKQQPGAPISGKELLILQLVDLNDLVGTFGKTYSEERTRQFASYLSNRCPGPCGYFGRAVFAVFADRQSVKALFDSLLVHRTPEGGYTHIVAGSAHSPEHGMTSAELIRRAEMALAIGLFRHERWVVYDSSMEPDPLNVEILSRFREDRVDGLYSVFQPQVDLKTGTIAAAEALVRWTHPVLGPIGPEKFIPLIEKAGLVPTVTAMMIDEAVRLAARLRRMDQPIAVSVNIAVYDLVATDLPSIVTAALNEHGGRAEDLKLELTETSFASDCGEIRGVLQQLNQMGVGITIDDFGTGFSSLFYLSIFPVEELKIDRTFVADMSSNERNCSIVRSTILLANQLGLRSVAEGAEDETTVRMLKEFGCDRVQGYVFSKPLPEPDFVAFLQRNSNALKSH